jgi:hypothetical protein
MIIHYSLNFILQEHKNKVFRDLTRVFNAHGLFILPKGWKHFKYSAWMYIFTAFLTNLYFEVDSNYGYFREI